MRATPGSESGTSVYFDNPTALKIAEESVLKNKVVGAICIAPSILANAGILAGKNATVWPSQKANLQQHGVNYIGDDLVVDGKIITASGPQSATKFGEKILELLRKS